MMIAGHDQNVQNGQRKNKKLSSEMLDDSCCAFFIFSLFCIMRIILIIPFMYVFAF